jgi:hypothetical protein
MLIVRKRSQTIVKVRFQQMLGGTEKIHEKNVRINGSRLMCGQSRLGSAAEFVVF